MAKFIDSAPDKIEEIRDQGHLFYFANGKDPDKLVNGAEYAVVYSPSRYNTTWHTVNYQVMRNSSGNLRAPKMLNGRNLEPNEVKHFETLMAENKS